MFATSNDNLLQMQEKIDRVTFDEGQNSIQSNGPLHIEVFFRLFKNHISLKLNEIVTRLGIL